VLIHFITLPTKSNPKKEEIMSGFRKKTVLLMVAAEAANYEMVELLLKNGANPNLVYGEKGLQESVLWELQYTSEDADEDIIRLSIAKLLLDYGASPHIKIDEEDLLKWADFYWGNNDDGMQADYRLKFIRLLEDYEEAQDFNQMVYDFLSE
jgi:ankyrin repeat protein